MIGICLNAKSVMLQMILDILKGRGTTMTNYGAHPTHCCKWHGCKYGDPDCPVVTGKVKQLYLCEDCYEDLEQEEYHRYVLKSIEEIKEFKKEKANEEH
jgi:hypothetical protein